MLDAVLLDWEGVLADTARVRRDALLRALSDEGVRLDAEEDVPHREGPPRPDSVGEALAHLCRADATLADLVGVRATRAFAERLGKGFVLRPGAREFVERLQLASRLAIVTLATRAETEFMLRLAGLDGAVSAIVSADDGVAPPPAPASYECALGHLARLRPLRRDRVVAIAQTSSALRAARAAGVRSVAVGAPAHVAVDADGVVDAIDGLSVSDLARMVGIAARATQP